MTNRSGTKAYFLRSLRILVDEYQDCSIRQHAIVYYASFILPVCVMGDDMQAIFGFGDDPLADWAKHVCGHFESAGSLDRPWRWINASAEPFGQWLLDVRGRLITAADHPKLLGACRTAPPDGRGSVLIVGESTSPGSQRRFASQTPGAVTVEAVDLRDLVSFAAGLDLNTDDALQRIASFADEVMTNVGAADLVRRTNTIMRGAERREASATERAAISFLGDRSPEFGEALARAFEDAAGPLADRWFEAVERGFVSRADLDDFSALTPSGIDAEGVERQLYEDVLFAKGALGRPDDLCRRETLLLLLHVASHLGRTPNVAETRWLLYAGADDKNEQFGVDAPARKEQRRLWWVYQANDLLHYSYETLLKYTLDTLEDYPTGIALNTLVTELVSALSEADHNWPLTWRDFLAAQPPAQNANGNTPNSERSFVEAIAPTSGLNHRTTPEAAWAALRLLAVVVNRAQAESAIIDAALGRLDREGFHSLVTEIDFLTACQDQPFPRTVARIIEERIVKRHLWVAHRKFRYQNDYTFLIEADDGRVRLRAGNGPVLTNPRLATAITFLEDIHLIDAHGVTARGESLLEAL